MNSQILPIHMIYGCALNETKYSLGSSVFSFVIAGYSQICRTGNGGSLCDLSVAGPRKCCLGPGSWGHRSPLLPLPDRLLFSPVSLLQTLHAQPAPAPFLITKLLWGFVSFWTKKRGEERGKAVVQSLCPPVAAHGALSSLPGLLQESPQAPPASALASCPPIQPPPSRNRSQAVSLPCERALWCFFTVLRM